MIWIAFTNNIPPPATAKLSRNENMNRKRAGACTTRPWYRMCVGGAVGVCVRSWCRMSFITMNLLFLQKPWSPPHPHRISIEKVEYSWHSALLYANRCETEDDGDRKSTLQLQQLFCWSAAVLLQFFPLFLWCLRCSLTANHSSLWQMANYGLKVCLLMRCGDGGGGARICNVAYDTARPYH